MKNLLAATFFVLNGQCWYLGDRQAINLANASFITQLGNDIHIYGADRRTIIDMDLAPFVEAMLKQCGAAPTKSSP